MSPIGTPDRNALSAPPSRGHAGGASWTLRLLALALLALGAGACAGMGHRSERPVSIDARPTPPQPAPEPADGTGAPASGVAPVTPAPVVAAAPARSRIEADTLAAHAVLERCGRRRLLPEQESTIESARQLLADTRAAALRGDLPRAESLARQVRQLASSLNCP